LTSGEVVEAAMVRYAKGSGASEADDADEYLSLSKQFVAPAEWVYSLSRVACRVYKGVSLSTGSVSLF